MLKHWFVYSAGQLVEFGLHKIGNSLADHTFFAVYSLVGQTISDFTHAYNFSLELNSVAILFY